MRLLSTPPRLYLIWAAENRSSGTYDRSSSEFSGQGSGIGLSPCLAEAARRLVDEEGLGGRVEFRSWDKRDLDHSDGKFEAVSAHTLVSHVPEALTVLKIAGRPSNQAD